MKKTLNLALDLGVKNDFIDMVTGFIVCKKQDINTNDKVQVNLHVFNPLIQKCHGLIGIQATDEIASKR
ncbi:15392_t:CDS:2, partial [Funneliformis geosporum]